MPKLKETESKLLVRSIYKKSGIVQDEKSSEEIVVIRLEEAPTATVSVDKSITKNLGSYESLKVSAFISVPVYLNDDEIERAFDYANQRVEKAIVDILREEGLVNE